MAEGYCVKCKAKKEIANGVEETMKNGRKAIKGKCPTCGTVMFKILGDEAVRKVRSVVGNLSPERRSGETIRGTYGDLISDEETGHIHYFEPAVLAAPSPEEAEAKLKLWARHSDKDGGVLENVIAYGP